LQTALLAIGDEGDPEEGVEVAPLAKGTLPALGLGRLTVALPRVLSSAAVFQSVTLETVLARDYTSPVHTHRSSWGGGYYG